MTEQDAPGWAQEGRAQENRAQENRAQENRAPVEVVGTVGAEPAVLAARLDELVAPAETDGVVRVLAVDLSIDSGAEEDALLAELLATGGPVALVGVGAGRVIGWPRRLAAARDRLDPQHLLPVFAVVLAAGPETGGLAALARWCAAPDWAAAPKQPVRKQSGANNPHAAGRTARPAAGQPQTQLDPAGRVDRLAGARAGLAGLRVRLSGRTRSGAQELSQCVASSCERLALRDVPVFIDWLEAALERYRDTVLADLAAGAEHVRAAALVGLPAQHVPLAAPSAGAVAPVPDAVRRRIAADELVLLALGASAGLGVGRVTVAPLLTWAGVGGLATVLTVLIGLGVAAGVVAVRRQGAVRAALRRDAGEAIAAMRGRLEHAVATGLTAVEAQISRDLPVRPRVVEPNAAAVRPTL